MSEPAVVVRGLCKSFGAKEAVAGIDLEIAAGSLGGLVGPNGAGKTTSLSMMTGLLRPDVGQILINGLDVWADGPRAAKAAIGVVPDQARLFERLSGAEMLEYAGRLRGMAAAEARSRATQLLDVLDLTADAKRLVADYSTGMRKKAMLGCALIHNPSVLFLDEPLEGVDPVSADVIRRLLTRFAASGSTVLFSSHVMELVVAPYPMDKRPGNPMRQAAQGYSFYQVLGVFGSVGGTAIAVLPLIFATVLSNADPAAIRMPVLLLCGAAYGLVLALAGVRIAALAAERRLPELAKIAIRSKL